MGLLNNKKQENGGDCDVVLRDCVGKIGECPVVISVDECKFDRNDQVFTETTDCSGHYSDRVMSPPKDFEEIDMTMEDFYKRNENVLDEVGEEPTNEEILTDNWQKDMLDEIIGVLVKYHNKL